MLCARYMRLISDSWSCVSRIWKSCGRLASRWCARSIRLHRPWKVPIHMPRVLTGVSADSRSSISLRRLVGEGDGEDRQRARLPGGEQPGDARGEHARLAAAGAGEDQRRRVRQRHRGELFGIEVFEKLVGGHGQARVQAAMIARARLRSRGAPGLPAIIAAVSTTAHPASLPCRAPASPARPPPTPPRCGPSST